MKIGLLLIALGFGYKIYAEANSAAKKKLKALGRAVGIFMMVVSVVFVLCGIYYKANYGFSGGCSAVKTGKICPFSGKVIPEVNQ
jgi:Na+/proline symporter